MKISEMSSKEYEIFYNLCKLQQQLTYKKLDDIELEYLNLLRNEISERLIKYNKKGSKE